MKIYLFYGVKKHYFIGYTKKKHVMNEVINSRPSDFEIIEASSKLVDLKELVNNKFKKIKLQNNIFYLTNEEEIAFSMYVYDYMWSEYSQIGSMVSDILKLSSLTDKEFNLIMETCKMLVTKLAPLVEFSEDGDKIWKISKYCNVGFLVNEFLEMKREDESLADFFGYMAM